MDLHNGITNASLNPISMNKPQRCLLHLGCIARKGLRGQSWAWHWQHLLRELGIGVYSEARQGDPNHRDKPCYT